MSIVYIYELDISLYFYVSFSSSIKLKPTINFMGNFKYNLFFVCAVILLCALEKCFPYSVFKELTLQKKKVILIEQNAVSIAPSLVPPRFQKHHYY